MRLGMVAAKYHIDSDLNGMTAPNHGEIVGYLVAAQDADVGQENIRSQIVNEAWNLQSYLARHVGNNPETVVVPLHAGFVLQGCAELVIPRSLDVAVVIVNRAAG